MKKYLYIAMVLTLLVMSGSMVFAGGSLELNPDGTVPHYQAPTTGTSSSGSGRISTLPSNLNDDSNITTNSGTMIWILLVLVLLILGSTSYWLWKKRTGDKV